MEDKPKSPPKRKRSRKYGHEVVGIVEEVDPTKRMIMPILNKRTGHM